MKKFLILLQLIIVTTYTNAQKMNSMKEKCPQNKVNVDFSVWPKGELNTGYAKYFIGFQRNKRRQF